MRKYSCKEKMYYLLFFVEILNKKEKCGLKKNLKL